jgi:hypothetical protein
MSKSFYSFILFIITGCVTVQADELFSYTVLKFPHRLSNVNQSWYQVITTQEQWQAFYAKSGAQNPNAAPKIDFNVYQLVMGGLEKPSGGYGVIIENVAEGSDGIYIEVLDTSIDFKNCNCAVGQGFTYPEAALLIKKTDKPIKVHISTAVTESINLF